MLQLFYLDVAYVALAIHVCCKCMFQIFQLFQTYVASVLSGYRICCSVYTHIFLYVLDVCCSKCFMLQLFHEHAWQGDTGEGSPLGRNGPRVRAGSETGVEHKAVSMGVAIGTEHEAAYMGRQ